MEKEMNKLYILPPGQPGLVKTLLLVGGIMALAIAGSIVNNTFYPQLLPVDAVLLTAFFLAAYLVVRDYLRRTPFHSLTTELPHTHISEALQVYLLCRRSGVPYGKLQEALNVYKRATAIPEAPKAPPVQMPQVVNNGR
jgi:hypothetical protein